MNRKKNTLKIILTAVIILLAAAAVTVGIILLTGSPNSAPSASIEPAAPSAGVDAPAGSVSLSLDAGEGVHVIEAGRYSGMFLEDGSDETVSGILMLKLENSGAEDIQYGVLTLRDAEGAEYTFEFSTLLAGECMTVLEKNRSACSEGFEAASAHMQTIARFAAEPSLLSDVLSFSTSDHSITVKNISGEAFGGGRVYYKNASDSILIGGITYTVSIPALNAGEEVNLLAGHWLEGSSRLMFATDAG